jgi:hypothetical protein
MSKINEIIDPEEKVIKLQTKSVLVSQLDDDKSDNQYKTAVLRLFDVNNPHMKDVFPTSVYKFSNTEKVRIRRLNVSYYLEGEDIVVNDLEELYITHEGHKLILRGYQVEVESRVAKKNSKSN